MSNQKWYLSTWFISVWFAFSIFVIPFIVGVVLLVLQIIESKKVKEEWENSGFGDILQAREQKDNLEKESKKLISRIENLKSELSLLVQDITKRKNEIVVLDDEILFQSFGFYDPKYEMENSEDYKNQLDVVREKQKEMVKNDLATNHSDKWTVDGSKKKGQAMNKDNIKLALRAFNTECDSAISKAKFNNVDAIEKRIKTAYKSLNNMNKRNQIEIKHSYLALKLDELYLAYEYEVKKEEEREEQRIIKEHMKEEKRVQQEIERERAKLEKDEQHFKIALGNYIKQLENATDEMKTEIQNKINEINNSLEDIKKEKEAVDFREQNAKAGYVYVISNIGSFGENIYKIGMTRRLEPLERINELGNASVPFTFDVHAMIFSDDAPKLENALHKSFERYQVNKVNPRKEFFQVSLEEITRVVKENHNKTVEITKMAQAEEYRKSLLMKKQEEKLGA